MILQGSAATSAEGADGGEGDVGAANGMDLENILHHVAMAGQGTCLVRQHSLHKDTKSSSSDTAHAAHTVSTASSSSGTSSSASSGSNPNSSSISGSAGCIVGQDELAELQLADQYLQDCVQFFEACLYRHCFPICREEAGLSDAIGSSSGSSSSGSSSSGSECMLHHNRAHSAASMLARLQEFAVTAEGHLEGGAGPREAADTTAFRVLQFCAQHLLNAYVTATDGTNAAQQWDRSNTITDRSIDSCNALIDLLRDLEWSEFQQVSSNSGGGGESSGEMEGSNRPHAGHVSHVGTFTSYRIAEGVGDDKLPLTPDQAANKAKGATIFASRTRLMGIVRQHRALAFGSKARLYKKNSLKFARIGNAASTPSATSPATPASTCSCPADSVFPAIMWCVALPELSQTYRERKKSSFAGNGVISSSDKASTDDSAAATTMLHQKWFDSRSDACAAFWEHSAVELEAIASTTLAAGGTVAHPVVSESYDSNGDEYGQAKLELEQAYGAFRQLAEHWTSVGQVQPFQLEGGAAASDPELSERAHDAWRNCARLARRLADAACEAAAEALSAEAALRDREEEEVGGKECPKGGGEASGTSPRAGRGFASSGHRSQSSHQVVSLQQQSLKYLQRHMEALYHAGVCACVGRDFVLAQRALESAQHAQGDIEAVHRRAALYAASYYSATSFSSPPSSSSSSFSSSSSSSSSSVSLQLERFSREFLVACGDVSFHLGHVYIRLGRAADALQEGLRADAYYSHSGDTGRTADNVLLNSAAPTAAATTTGGAAATTTGGAGAGGDADELFVAFDALLRGRRRQALGLQALAQSLVGKTQEAEATLVLIEKELCVGPVEGKMPRCLCGR